MHRTANWLRRRATRRRERQRRLLRHATRTHRRNASAQAELVASDRIQRRVQRDLIETTKKFVSYKH